jgi:hypothetical protein
LTESSGDHQQISREFALCAKRKETFFAVANVILSLNDQRTSALFIRVATRAAATTMATTILTVVET